MAKRCPGCSTLVTPREDGSCPRCREILCPPPTDGSEAGWVVVWPGRELPPVCIVCGQRTDSTTTYRISSVAPETEEDDGLSVGSALLDVVSRSMTGLFLKLIRSQHRSHTGGLKEQYAVSVPVCDDCGNDARATPQDTMTDGRRMGFLAHERFLKALADQERPGAAPRSGTRRRTRAGR